jgi:hypothetical protein
MVGPQVRVSGLMCNQKTECGTDKPFREYIPKDLKTFHKAPPPSNDTWDHDINIWAPVGHSSKPQHQATFELIAPGVAWYSLLSPGS